MAMKAKRASVPGEKKQLTMGQCLFVCHLLLLRATIVFLSCLTLLCSLGLPKVASSSSSSSSSSVSFSSFLSSHNSVLSSNSSPSSSPSAASVSSSSSFSYYSSMSIARYNFIQSQHLVFPVITFVQSSEYSFLTHLGLSNDDILTFKKK